MIRFSRHMYVLEMIDNLIDCTSTFTHTDKLSMPSDVPETLTFSDGGYRDSNHFPV